VDTADPLRSFDVEAPFEVLHDPVDQWLDWEEQANLMGFRASTRPVQVEMVSVPRDQLEIHRLPGAPREIVDRFFRRDRVLFPRHPLNRDPSVSWFQAPVRERWSARFTSSRTLAMFAPDSGSALFSLKLSTDHPHPDFRQPEKTKLRQESLDAIEWVQVLARIDRLLAPLDDVDLVHEVLVVLEKDGETGFMVRDLRLFQDGRHYLPALSLPWVGRQIARRHGQPFDRFWGRHFARRVGRAKARLLARYGLWYETPNPQNLVIQLDPQLRPTGRLVFRDVGDGECATDARESTSAPWTRLLADIRPETRTSFWAFGEAGAHSVEAGVLEAWYAAHDDAYFAELSDWFPEVAPSPALPREARLDHWNAALRSDPGAEAIARAFVIARR